MAAGRFGFYSEQVSRAKEEKKSLFGFEWRTHSGAVVSGAKPLDRDDAGRLARFASLILKGCPHNDAYRMTYEDAA